MQQSKKGRKYKETKSSQKQQLLRNAQFHVINDTTQPNRTLESCIEEYSFKYNTKLSLKDLKILNNTDEKCSLRDIIDKIHSLFVVDDYTILLILLDVQLDIYSEVFIEYGTYTVIDNHMEDGKDGKKVRNDKKNLLEPYGFSFEKYDDSNTFYVNDANILYQKYYPIYCENDKMDLYLPQISDMQLIYEDNPKSYTKKIKKRGDGNNSQSSEKTKQVIYEFSFKCSYPFWDMVCLTNFDTVLSLFSIPKARNGIHYAQVSDLYKMYSILSETAIIDSIDYLDYSYAENEEWEEDISEEYEDELKDEEFPIPLINKVFAENYTFYNTIARLFDAFLPLLESFSLTKSEKQSTWYPEFEKLYKGIEKNTDDFFLLLTEGMPLNTKCFFFLLYLYIKTILEIKTITLRMKYLQKLSTITKSWNENIANLKNGEEKRKATLNELYYNLSSVFSDVKQIKAKFSSLYRITYTIVQENLTASQKNDSTKPFFQFAHEVQNTIEQDSILSKAVNEFLSLEPAENDTFWDRYFSPKSSENKKETNPNESKIKFTRNDRRNVLFNFIQKAAAYTVSIKKKTKGRNEERIEIMRGKKFLVTFPYSPNVKVIDENGKKMNYNALCNENIKNIKEIEYKGKSIPHDKFQTWDIWSTEFWICTDILDELGIKYDYLE